MISEKCQYGLLHGRGERVRDTRKDRQLDGDVERVKCLYKRQGTVQAVVSLEWIKLAWNVRGVGVVVAHTNPEMHRA